MASYNPNNAPTSVAPPIPRQVSSTNGMPSPHVAAAAAGGHGHHGIGIGIGTPVATAPPVGIASSSPLMVHRSSSSASSPSSPSPSWPIATQVTTLHTELDKPSGMVCSVQRQLLLVAEAGLHRIRSADLATVGTKPMAVAAGGNNGEFGVPSDVPVEYARFSSPTGIAVADNGDVFIADRNNNVIRKISNGMVTTLATGFNAPRAVVVNGRNEVYVADELFHRIMKITSTAVLVAAGDGDRGHVDGPPARARFNQPRGMVWDSITDCVYIADYGNNAIRRVLPDGSVDTWLAGIMEPCAIAVDEKGGMFVCGNHAVCHISAGKQVTPLAGTAIAGFTNGPAHIATFNCPRGLVWDAARSRLLVADNLNSAIRCIDILPMGALPSSPSPLPLPPNASASTPSMNGMHAHVPSLPNYPAPLVHRVSSSAANQSGLGISGMPPQPGMGMGMAMPMNMGVASHPATSAMATQLLLIQGELERARLASHEESAIRRKNEETIISLRHEVAQVQAELTRAQEALEAAKKEMTLLRASIGNSNSNTPPPLPSSLPPALPVAHMESKHSSLSSLGMTASGEDGKMEVVPPEAVYVEDTLPSGVLGNGAYGVTYRGMLYDGVVAVKRMHGLILGSHNLARWQREVGIMATVKHPNLVMLFGVCYRPSNDLLVPDLIMELMDGGTLDAALSRTGEMALTMRQRCGLMLDVAHGLKYLHTRTPAIIHRDIHPSNVLLRSTVHLPTVIKPAPTPTPMGAISALPSPAASTSAMEVPKLEWTAAVADFGSAVHSVEGNRSLSTAPGHITHSAPETMTGQQTTAVDVYAFGVLLYTCLVSSNVAQYHGQRITQFGRMAPGALRDLILRCCADDPARRPSMDDVARVLDGLQE